MTSRLLKNDCGGPSAALRGARPLAYPIDMSRVLRAVRLASGHARYVFQQSARRLMTTILPIVLGVFACAIAHAAPISAISGLKNPESALTGPDGRVYVSEIGEFGKDGDGRVSVIGADGKPQVFAQGMDDPKGLVFIGPTLYVADKTRVLKVAPDGQWRVLVASAAFPAPPQFLNDLAADRAGNLYLSDSGDLKGQGGAVYRIAPSGEVSTVVSGATHPLVLAPNGLLMEGETALLEVDFASGVLYRIALGSREMQKLAEGFGGGDGIVRAPNGVLAVSDWKNGKVFTLDPHGKVTLLKAGYQSAADIGLSQDGRFILVPDMKAGELHWLAVP